MKINDDLVPVVVSATEPTGHNRKKIWKQFTGNLFNINNITDQHFIESTNGSMGSSSAWCISDYIKITEGEKLTINGNYSSTVGNSVYGIYYNSSKNVVSSIAYTDYKTNGTILTVPNGASYIRLSIPSSEKSTFKIYVAGKEYILNKDNIYEEFDSYLIEKVLTLETKMDQIYSNGKVKAEFEAISLPQSGVDLNNYTNSGFYYCRMDGWAQSYSNCPSQYAFGLLVIKHVNCFQMVIPYANSPYGNNAPRIFVRNGATSNTGGWTSWKVLSSWS